MLRSYLYVPGDKPELLAKALLLRGMQRPDAILLDLEDAVAVSQKAKALALVAEATHAPSTDCEAPALFVRVNSGDLGLGDLSAIVGPGLAGVCLPKASVSAIARAASVLSAMGSDVGIIALVETASAVQQLAEIAVGSHVIGMALGEADLGAELGIAQGSDHAFWPIRMQVVVAAVAAGLNPPTGPVSTNFRDLETFRHSTIALRNAGFGARSAIHPAQIPIINEAMRPSPAETAAAQELVASFDAAVAAGQGVMIDDRGRMVDEAIARAARRLLT